MAITSIKSSGGDYPSAIAHEAAENGNHVVAGESAIGQGYRFTDTAGALTIAGGTSDASNYYELTSADEAKPQMPANEAESYNFDAGATGANILVSDDNVHLTNFAQKITTTTAATTVGVWIDGATDPDGVIIDGLHVYGDSQSVAASFYGIISISINTSTIRNNYIGNLNSSSGTRRGVGVYSNAGTGNETYVYNNLVYGDMENGYEERHPADFMQLKNNICIDSRSANFITSGTGTGHEYNVSGDTSAPGTNALINQTTAIFVSATNLRLASDIAGVNLSAAANYPFDTDFDKIDGGRTAWSRGPVDFITSGSGIVPVLASPAIRPFLTR